MLKKTKNPDWAGGMPNQEEKIMSDMIQLKKLWTLALALKRAKTLFWQSKDSILTLVGKKHKSTPPLNDRIIVEERPYMRVLFLQLCGL